MDTELSSEILPMCVRKRTDCSPSEGNTLCWWVPRMSAGSLIDNAPNRRASVYMVASGSFTGIPYQEQVMNKDQVRGRVKEAVGKVKEVTGKVVGNKTLEAKGKIQKTAGEAQAKSGDLKRDVKKGD